MFFILSKVLSLFLMPVTWLVVLLIWAFRTKKSKRKKILLASSIAYTIIIFNMWLAMTLMGWWELHEKPKPGKVYDYAIVLGGMTDLSRKEGFHFHRGADRLWQVLPLYYQGKVKNIIISGGSGRLFSTSKPEAQRVGEYLNLIQFPDSSLVLEDKSRNTYENALFSAQILGDQKDSVEILLVTSAFHMRRSQGIFLKQNFRFDMLTTDEYYQVSLFTLDDFLFPSADALKIYELLVREMIGYVVYDIVGYI